MATTTRKQELIEEFFAIMGKMRQAADSLSNVSPEDKIATMLQMHALGYLKTHHNSTVGELAERLYMSSSAAAQFTDRLVTAEFVRREQDSQDRRIVRLSLTKNGEKELVGMRKKMIEKMGKVLEHVSEKDLEELVRIDKKILHSLEKKK